MNTEELHIKIKNEKTIPSVGQSDKITSGYVYLSDRMDCSFYRLPKVFFADTRYGKISTDAKLLYALLLDRMELSAHNGWQDEKGRIYLYFTIEQVCELLNFGEKKIIRLFRELENAEMIDRKKQGLCKAAIIYPKKFIGFHMSEEPLQNCKKDNPGVVEKAVPELSKSHASDTEYNHTENSDTDLSISETDWEEARERIKEQLEYDIIAERGWRDELDEIVSIMTEVMCLRAPVLRIGKYDYPISYVRERLSQVKHLHVEYVRERMSESASKIKDIKSYLIAALFNAPATMTHYYQAEVNYDYRSAAE